MSVPLATPRTRRYDAFISYSHAADGRMAPALQKALQQLAKPWYRRRSLEVFRDQTGLSVDPHLWGAIVKALDTSEWLLLLTSPDAARSEWVNREIEHWKQHRPLDRILPVLTDGHWQWDPATGDFTEDSDAVAPALRGVFTDEPRHLDLRWAHHEKQLDLRNSRFRAAVAEVAAPMHGKTKDEIEGEDVRQHRRTIRLAWSATGALAVLTVAAVVGAGVAVTNAHRAEDRRIDAEAQRLSAQSQAELASPDLAFLLAAAGYRLRPNVQTEGALLTAVANMPEVRQRIPVDMAVTAVATSADAERVWLGTADGTVVSHRFSDGAEVARAPKVLGADVTTLVPAGQLLIAANAAGVTTLDADLRPISVRGTPDGVTAVAVDPASGRIAAGTPGGEVYVWPRDSDVPTTRFRASNVEPGAPRYVTALAWTPDGGLVTADVRGFARFNLERPQSPLWAHPDAGWVTALTVMPDGTVVAGDVYGSVSFWHSDGSRTDAGTQRDHTDSVEQFAVTGLSPEDGSLVSVSSDGMLIFWDHRTGRDHPGPFESMRVDDHDATAVAWDPEQPLRGVAAGVSGGAVLLDYSSTDLARPAQTLPGWNTAAGVALSPHGHRMVVFQAVAPPEGADGPGGGIESELVLTDADRPAPDGPSTRVPGIVDQLAFAPDESMIVATTLDGGVALWDGTSAEASVTAVSPGQPITQLAISPDGSVIATGAQDFDTPEGAGAIRLWRVEDRQLVEAATVEAPPLGYGLAFTLDGSRLIMGGNGGIRIHPMAGGSAATVDLGDDAVRALAVSPDGRTVAAAIFDGPIRFFDLGTGEPTGDDIADTSRATELAFRADGNQLVTVGENGRFTVWDVPSRRELSGRPMIAVDRTLSGTTIDPSLAVGEDHAYTTSFADGRIARWPLTPEQWITIGCTVFARDLTDAEKERFGVEDAAPICPD